MQWTERPCRYLSERKKNSTENEYVTFVIFLSEDIVKTNNLLLNQK